MIIGVAEISLQQLVIDVAHRQLGAHARHAHGLELQITQRSEGILGQGLIDAQRNLGPRGHIAADQVGFDELMSEVHGIDSQLWAKTLRQSISHCSRSILPAVLSLPKILVRCRPMRIRQPYSNVILNLTLVFAA